MLNLSVQYVNHPGFEGRVFGYSNRNYRWFESTAAIIESTKGERGIRRGLSYPVTCYQSGEASTAKTHDTRFVVWIKVKPIDTRSFHWMLSICVTQVHWAMNSLVSATLAHWAVMRAHRLARVARNGSKKLVRRNAEARNENSIRNISFGTSSFYRIQFEFIYIDFLLIFFS